MWFVFWWQFPFLCQDADGFLQQRHVEASALTSFVCFFEASGVFDLVGHFSSWLNKSSASFASYTLRALMSSSAFAMPVFCLRFIVQPIFFDRLLRKDISESGNDKKISSVFAAICIPFLCFSFSNKPIKNWLGNASVTK